MSLAKITNYTVSVIVTNYMQQTANAVVADILQSYTMCYWDLLSEIVIITDCRPLRDSVFQPTTNYWVAKAISHMWDRILTSI